MSSGFSILEEKGNNSPIRVVNTSGLGLAQGFTTQNSTGFYQIRRALCALFSEDEGQHRGSSRIWYEDWEHDQMDADDSYWNEWDWEPNDWSPSTQVYWQDDPSWWSYWPEEETEDVQPDEQSADPEEVQLVEAFNIASEAIRALKDAREAVRRIRQSRVTMLLSRTVARAWCLHPVLLRLHLHLPKDRQKVWGLVRVVACGHGYQQCPDRFSQGGFTGKSKGKSKSMVQRKVWWMERRER